MEPVDDILIPREPAKAGQGRLRIRHVLRALALLIILGSVAYAIMLYRQDAAVMASHLKGDLMGVLPLFFFGVILWFFAGFRGEMSRPLFRNAADAPTEVRMDRRNLVWVLASVLSGFIGLCAVTLAATLLLRHELLVTAYPWLREIQLSPQPILVMGGLLLVLSVVSLGIALRRPKP